jgi:anti-anti-sigma regulatory factor
MADNHAKGTHVVTLPTILDVSAAQTLKEALCDTILSGENIALSGADVERVGTPAVQVLLSAAQTSLADGRSFALTQPSEPLRLAFADLGLTDTLEQWSNTNG